MKLGVLSSHAGTTLQAIIDACAAQSLAAEVAVVISNHSNSGAAQRARRHTIPFHHISQQIYGDQDCDRQIEQTLRTHKVDLVVLAGYMKKLGPHTIRGYNRKIINTHPALLPLHGGQGMYGNRVHQAVISARETVTGITIHWVDEEYDHGPIIAQCEVAVLPEDTVESLAARVQKHEKELLISTLQTLCAGAATPSL